MNSGSDYIPVSFSSRFNMIRLPIVVFVFLCVLLPCMGLAQQVLDIRLFRFGAADAEKPGVLTAQGTYLDVTAFGEDYNENFFATNGIARLKKWFDVNKSRCPEIASGSRIASCIARPSKIVAIGLNYRDHVKESGAAIPNEPVIFMKSATALSGPNDLVVIPRNSTKTDYEVELAVVIGRKGAAVSEDSARNYIAGYTIINDYSEREWQLQRPGSQWDKGKSADTFAPLGPWLVPATQVIDPNNLSIWLSWNGKRMQQSNTSDMIFRTERLVSEVSKYMTLLPGDVIATGTPAGVIGLKGPRWLQPGDIVELGIENLGSQKQIMASPIQYYLGDDAYKDYQAWVALGLGGLPHTFDGYVTMKRLGEKMRNPLDVQHLISLSGKPGDVKTLSKLPKRTGHRPHIAPFAIPHRQTDQHNDTTLRKAQMGVIEEFLKSSECPLAYKQSFFERHNKALFIRDSVSGNPTIMAITHAEIGHARPTDGSMHMILSPSDAQVVITSGWGELHGLAGQTFAPGRALAPGYMMIYAPRDKRELEVVKQIVKAAIRYNCYNGNGSR